MSEENKAISRRLFEEAWSGGNLDVIDEVTSPDFVAHVAGGEPIRGPEGARAFVSMFRAAFPDIEDVIEHQVAEGDFVANRFRITGTHQGEFMGIPATGKQITVEGMNMQRFSGGKIVEGWGVFDMLGMLQQLGVVPEMATARR